ncbi:MAG: uncharacterized membrane protein (DUF106 family) [Candidatus Paceibacteria bacterium]|jgi:uncharacterized membrane protein (DUF106 family)
MKKYINTILIATVLLLIFPFLGFPELWENLYVIILGFIIAMSTLFLRHKSGIVTETDEESSLQDYVKELQDKFKQQMKEGEPKTPNRISDVQINHD